MIAGSAVCGSFKLELLQGIHDLRNDDFYCALYTAAASLGVDTTVYMTDGEIAGGGYTAGGLLLRHPQIFGPAGGVAFATWDDPTWEESTLTARAALIYNGSKQQRAVAVLDFLADQSSNDGDFTIHLPSPSPTRALIRLL